MGDFSAFWILPILSLFITMFFSYLAGFYNVKTKFPDCLLGLVALIFVIGWHWMMIENTQALSSLAGRHQPQMEYYKALFLYGSNTHKYFNYTICGIQGFFFVLGALNWMGIGDMHKQRD